MYAKERVIFSLYDWGYSITYRLVKSILAKKRKNNLTVNIIEKLRWFKSAAMNDYSKHGNFYRYLNNTHLELINFIQSIIRKKDK